MKYLGLAFAALTAGFVHDRSRATARAAREIVQVKGDLYRAGERQLVHRIPRDAGRHHPG